MTAEKVGVEANFDGLIGHSSAWSWGTSRPAFTAGNLGGHAATAQLGLSWLPTSIAQTGQDVANGTFFMTPPVTG